MRLTIKPCNALPTEIKLHQASGVLEISFDDGSLFNLPCEYLRVYTPSAEAVGHGPGQEVLQVGKENVSITEIKAVGSYGISPLFSDGHNTGIYTWDLLYRLGADYPTLWADYLQCLKQAGYARNDEAPTSVSSDQKDQ
ncbi:MAG: DUF971 domain-containing protein [Methylococcaceae bacterium]|jgi:DUF971 family protein